MALAGVAALVLLVAALLFGTRVAGSDESIVQLAPRDGLRFEPTSMIRVNPDAEAELVGLLNQLRLRAGLHPLVVDPRLTAVARHHSRDMYESGYFGHLSPDGLDPFDRLAAARIRYVVAGENLALGPDPERIQEQMLTSASHRANIIRSDHCKVGVGVYEGPYGLMATEVFMAWYPYGVAEAKRHCP